MKNWRVELTERGKTLAEVKIQIGIFQGDVLAPLLFLIEMISLNLIQNTQGVTNLLNLKKRLTKSSCLQKKKKKKNEKKKNRRL